MKYLVSTIDDRPHIGTLCVSLALIPLLGLAGTLKGMILLATLVLLLI